jgi:outer membrane protein assembly factor BamB
MSMRIMFAVLFGVFPAVLYGADVVPLGHPDFHPTPQRPVGFRGDGSGGFPGARGLVTEWGDRPDKNIVWKCEMPDFSYGGCIVVGDKVFTQSEPASLLCVDARTGKLLWEREHFHATWLDALPTDQRHEAIGLWRGLLDTLAVDPKRAKKVAASYPQHRSANRRAGGVQVRGVLGTSVAKYPKASFIGLWPTLPLGYTFSTPLSDGRYVWVKSAIGVVACYDLDGNRVWYRTFDTEAGHGCRSPLLVGGKLIVSHALFSGRAASHDRGWWKPTDPWEAAAWSQNNAVEVRPDFLTFPGDFDPEMVTALDPYSGKTLWQTRMTVGGTFGSGGLAQMRLGQTDLILTAHGGILRVSDGNVLRADLLVESYGAADAPVVAPGGWVASPLAGLTKIEPAGTDAVKVTSIDGCPKNRWRSLVAYGDRLYTPSGGFFDLASMKGGSATRPDEAPGPARGDRLFCPLCYGFYGCAIAADGKLYCPGADFGFEVHDISGTPPKLLASNSLEASDAQFIGYPFAQGNRLYVRGPLYLWCLGDPAAPYHSPAKPANLPAPVKTYVAVPGPDPGRRLEYEIKGEALFSLRPVAMAGRGGTWRVLEPQAAAPKEGTPVATCVGERSSPTRWLVAGLFPVGGTESTVGEFLLKDEPGDTPRAQIVPEPGAKIKCGGREHKFQPMAQEHYRNWPWAGQVITTIDVDKALGGQAGCLYLGASFRADGNVRLSFTIQRGEQKAGILPKVTVWLGGVQCLENTPIRLRQGHYPLLVRIKAGKPIPPEAECAVGLSFSRVNEDPWVALHRETMDTVLRLCPESEHAKRIKDVLEFDASCAAQGMRSEASPGMGEAPALSIKLIRIEPAADLEPGQGTPVFDYKDDRLVDAWLFAGPFTRVDRDEDYLRSMGGRAVARPTAGTKVEWSGKPVMFAPLETKYIQRDEGPDGGSGTIGVVGKEAVSQTWNSTFYFYTILRNDKPRQAQFWLLAPGPGSERWHDPARFAWKTWLSGVRVKDLDTLSIPKGVFPLMIEISCGESGKPGRLWMAPRFRDVGASDDDGSTRPLDAGRAGVHDEVRSAHSAVD